MKKFKSITALLACIFATLGALIVSPLPAFAENCTDICSAECTSVPDDIKAASGCSGYAIPEIQSVAVNIINGIILVLGTVAVIFIIYGGVTYMTSLGDPGKIKKARDAILYAVIGLVICVLAYAITNFAINLVNQDPAETQQTTEE